MGETITTNKKAYHDTSRQKIMPTGMILVNKITLIGNTSIVKDTSHG